MFGLYPPALTGYPELSARLKMQDKLQNGLDASWTFFPTFGLQGSSTAKVSLNRLVQLAKPTDPASTTIWAGERLLVSSFTTSALAFPCRVHWSANRRTSFSRSLYAELCSNRSRS